jgi:hypothetical protein
MKAFRLIHGVFAFAAAALAHADAVTDWNLRTGEIVTAAGLGTPPANRVMALVHTASYEAANAISHRYPSSTPLVQAPAGASVDAAIAGAHRAMLVQLVPAQRGAIDKAFAQALAAVAPGPARDAGVTVGEQAAAALLQRRASDKIAPDSYRPRTAPGVYVPTVSPAAHQWPLRTPWMLASASQFRPPAPPALTSERWARDYNEIKAVGGKTSQVRTPEQTAMALFWEATLPPIYHGMLHCAAELPGRDVTQNARLFAVATQAIDDAMIAIFDAKYHYMFWRPITAIRNGDIDGNDATQADLAWVPLIDTPLHPEYPCAHCTLAATVATVLEAELGSTKAPVWKTTSSAVNNTARQWIDLETFVKEVADARVYDGVHYRFSTEAGTTLGKQVGRLAADKFQLAAR